MSASPGKLRFYHIGATMSNDFEDDSNDTEVEETQSEEANEPVTSVPPTPKPKAKKPVPKKAVKPLAKAVKTVKKLTPKKAKPAKVERKTRTVRDDARKVSKASDGKLTTDQVRILRSMPKLGRSTTMAEIKKGCGMKEDQKYSGGFLKGLHELQESRMVKVDKDQDNRSHTYTSTEKGRGVLEKAEKAAKE